MRWLCLGLLLALAGCLGPTGRRAPSPRAETPSATRLPGGVYRVPLANCRVISPYGKRGRSFHTGIDLKSSKRGGDPVTAARGGKVIKIGRRGGYGNMVLLQHADGTMTRYAHLRRVDVGLGEAVLAGDVLGRVGDTGRATTPHLHFEILTADKRTVNPAPHIFKNQ